MTQIPSSLAREKPTLFLNFTFFVRRLLFFTTLDRYLIRQFVGPFLLAVGGFVVIGMIDILFTLVDLFINSSVSFFIVVRLLAYKVPAVMVLFFPMAVLFAVMLLMVRMAKDNEITVLRASGISTGRLLIPIISLCILATLIALFTNETLVPWSNKISDSLINQSVNKTPPPDIAENVFFKDQGSRYFYINKVHPKTGIMENVLVYEVSEAYPRVTTAKTAHWDQKTWTLTQGYIQDYDDNGMVSYTSHFEDMKINISRNLNSFYSDQKTPYEMDSRELKEQINTLQKGGVSTKNLAVEYYMKSSLPGACLIFGLIGIAFCTWFVQSGKDWWGVVIAVCTAVLSVGFYFFIVAVFRALGKSGIVPLITPFLGAWAPNILFGCVASAIVIYQATYK